MSDNKPKLSTEPYKGVRDFYPEEMEVQNYIFDTWRKVVKNLGYAEYGASILEYADLYRSKGNDEIVNDQMYLFKDKGDREVALRPEMTPTLSRMIAARRKGLKLPLRWFSIPNCFRYERPQRGRRREHWQLNCDLMGMKDPLEAEVEIISLAYKIMKEFAAKDEDFVIKVNDRQAMKGFREKLSPENDKLMMRLLDKRDKITDEEFKVEAEKLLGEGVTVEFKETEMTKNLLDKLHESGIKNAVFDGTITRGFDYYTGMVFEVSDTHQENNRSLFGGGRYDNLLEMFGVEPLPTVGFGMGDITIKDFLITHGLMPKHLKQE